MSKMVALRLHRIETLFTINHWKKEKTVDEVLIEAVPLYQNMFSKWVINESGQSKKGLLKKQEEWKRVFGKGI